MLRSASKDCGLRFKWAAALHLTFLLDQKSKQKTQENLIETSRGLHTIFRTATLLHRQIFLPAHMRFNVSTL